MTARERLDEMQRFINIVEGSHIIPKDSPYYWRPLSGDETHPTKRVPIKFYDEFKAKFPGSVVRFRGPKHGKRNTSKIDATHFYIVRQGLERSEPEDMSEPYEPPKTGDDLPHTPGYNKLGDGARAAADSRAQAFIFDDINDDPDGMGSYNIIWDGDTWKEAIPYDAAEKEVERILQIIDDSALQAHDNNDHLRVKKTADGDTMVWTVLDPIDGDYQEIRLEPSDMPAGYTGESIREEQNAECTRCSGLGRHPAGGEDCPECGGTGECPLSKESEELPPIHAIARDIIKNWKKVNFGAVPYLDAMQSLSTKHDDYGADSGSSIIAYGLSNMNSYSGRSVHDPELAKKHRAQLKQHLKEGIDLSTIIKTVLEEFPGQPKDFYDPDEDDLGPIAQGKSGIVKDIGDELGLDVIDVSMSDFEDDVIDPEYDDTELGLRFD